jgi:hypothetical protein
MFLVTGSIKQLEWYRCTCKSAAPTLIHLLDPWSISWGDLISMHMSLLQKFIFYTIVATGQVKHWSGLHTSTPFLSYKSQSRLF